MIRSLKLELEPLESLGLAGRSTGRFFSSLMPWIRKAVTTVQATWIGLPRASQPVRRFHGSADRPANGLTVPATVESYPASATTHILQVHDLIYLPSAQVPRNSWPSGHPSATTQPDSNLAQGMRRVGRVGCAEQLRRCRRRRRRWGRSICVRRGRSVGEAGGYGGGELAVE